jgi:hypothetical protein
VFAEAADVTRLILVDLFVLSGLGAGPLEVLRELGGVLLNEFRELRLERLQSDQQHIVDFREAMIPLLRRKARVDHDLRVPVVLTFLGGLEEVVERAPALQEEDNPLLAARV